MVDSLRLRKLVLSKDDEEKDDSSSEVESGDNIVQFGSLQRRPRCALDLRRNFFDGRATYFL